MTNLSVYIAVSMTRDIDIANLSVCPSVCPRPSVRNVPVSDENVLTYRHGFFHRTVTQSFCFYQHQTSSRNYDGVIPCGGTKYRWGVKISRFWTNNLIYMYLANDTRYHHSYYRKLIGTYIRSIKWCNFQWPWTDLNLVFKVTPLFDAKYLTNGYRYGHSYYRRRIKNRA